MGDKVEAKRTAGALGLPLVPGSAGAIDSVEEARGLAREIGYPVLIKAASGGVGRGMKVVPSEDQLDALIIQARSQAKNPFAADTFSMDTYRGHPSHITVQIYRHDTGNPHQPY